VCVCVCRALTLFSSFRDIPDYESSDPFRG
jgi:hypothetical protein